MKACAFFQAFFVDILIFAVDAPRAFFQRIFTQTTRYKGFGKCACFFYAPQRSVRRSKFFELIKMQSIEPHI